MSILRGYRKHPTKPSASSGGYLGRIAVCCRASKPRSGTAAKLVSAAEDWLRQKEVGVVELSYMIKKELAAISGRWLGYQPFRVLPTNNCSSKQL